MGAAVCQDFALLEEVCEWINAKATVPVWAKMASNITDITRVCTGVMMHGYCLVKKLCAELEDFMKMQNFTSIEDFIGASLGYFTTHMGLVQRQQEAIQQRKASRKGLQSYKDWTGDGFVKRV